MNTDGKFGFKFNYAYDANGHPDQYYCRSDHANYARYGIPIVFFSTGSHRDYHQVTDEAEYLDYDKFADVVRYVAALDGPGGGSGSSAGGGQAEAGSGGAV